MLTWMTGSDDINRSVDPVYVDPVYVDPVLRWQFILGECIDKHIRKAYLAPKNVI